MVTHKHLQAILASGNFAWFYSTGAEHYAEDHMHHEVCNATARGKKFLLVRCVDINRKDRHSIAGPILKEFVVEHYPHLRQRFVFICHPRHLQFIKLEECRAKEEPAVNVMKLALKAVGL